MSEDSDSDSFIIYPADERRRIWEETGFFNFRYGSPDRLHQHSGSALQKSLLSTVCPDNLGAGTESFTRGLLSHTDFYSSLGLDDIPFRSFPSLRRHGQSSVGVTGAGAGAPPGVSSVPRPEAMDLASDSIRAESVPQEGGGSSDDQVEFAGRRSPMRTAPPPSVLPLDPGEEPPDFQWSNWLGLDEFDLDCLLQHAHDGPGGEEDRCCVCTEKIEKGDQVITLSCKHYFCPECIKGWLRNSAVCPTCRKEVRV